MNSGISFLKIFQSIDQSSQNRIYGWCKRTKRPTSVGWSFFIFVGDVGGAFGHVGTVAVLRLFRIIEFFLMLFWLFFPLSCLFMALLLPESLPSPSGGLLWCTTRGGTCWSALGCHVCETYARLICTKSCILEALNPTNELGLKPQHGLSRLRTSINGKELLTSGKSITATVWFCTQLSTLFWCKRTVSNVAEKIETMSRWSEKLVVGIASVLVAVTCFLRQF